MSPAVEHSQHFGITNVQNQFHPGVASFHAEMALRFGQFLAFLIP